MSHYPIIPQLQNAWVCTFCGAKYPSEQERDLHMAGNCKDSPVPRIEEMQPQPTRQRPPMMKANMSSHSEKSQYYPRQDQAQGYGYHKAPNTPPQPLFQSQLQPPSRPNYPQQPGIPIPSQMQYPPTQPWDQPSSLRGYAPPHVHQEAGHSGYGVNRERFSYNIPPNEPDISPLAKANTPTTPSGDKAKVTIIWKKEIPTLEKEVTYIDNIQDPVTLAWSDERELFQGNATFSQGNHTGSLLFPTSGEMEEVQPFEVKKKGMAMVMVALKLVNVKSPIKSEPLKLQIPSSIPKLTKNESEEAKSVPPAEKENKGMREQLLRQNQEVKDKEEKIKRMREEMDCLTETIDTVEEDKQKMKIEMGKLDEKLKMTEMSSIRIQGSSEEQKLEKENQSLKNELELLRRKEPIDVDEFLAAKEQIDQLKSHINSLENTKLEDDRLKEKIQTLEAELKTLQAKEEEFVKLKKEQQKLVNTNKDLHAELNASIRDREELNKNAEVAKSRDTMRDKYSKIEKEKQDLREQVEGLHTLVNSLKVSTSNLKSKLEYSDKEKEKVKTEYAIKLEKELAKTEDLEKMKKHIDTNTIKQLEKELESEGENSAFLKQLIRKLNKENQTGEETVTKLKEELEQANKYKNSLEYKLEQMSQEITNRDSEILPDPTKHVNTNIFSIKNNIELEGLTTINSKYQLESENLQSD